MKQAAICEIAFPALERLLQVPKGVRISSLALNVEAESIFIRFEGMGWPVEPGARVPKMRPATIFQGPHPGEFIVNWHCPAPGETPEAYSARTNNGPSGTRELPVFDFAAEMTKAEVTSFDPASLFSCLQHYAENLYGVTSSMSGWTVEQPNAIKRAGIEHHGETAWTHIEALTGIMGMDNYEGYFDAGYEKPLMQAAIVASEYHRGVRS